MKSKTLIIVCCLLVVSPMTIKGQAADRIVALLLVECEAMNGTCDTQHLIRYRFSNGEIVSKDIILTMPTTSVRYDLGQNHIYQNRYVITHWGDIVDVKAKSLLHNGIGEYIGAEGTLIIHKVSRTDVKGFFYYDLKSNKYARLKLPSKWALPGLLSPDQTKSVSVSRDGFGEIYLHNLKGKKKTLGSGFQVDLSEHCCSLSIPPVLWISNDRILTQRSNGEIVILRFDGSIEPLVKINIKEPADSLPQFYRNPEGKIIYSCSYEHYILDVENRSYSPYEWESHGHGFESELEEHLEFWQRIRFHGEEIGRWWSCCAKTTKGHVSLEYADVGTNLGNPKGVKVWSGATNK